MKTQDYMKETTAAIVKMMQESPRTWIRGWDIAAKLKPQNPTTKTFYRGFNYMWLSMCAAHAGQINAWCTYKQAQNKGWQVRKGTKGRTVHYWDRFTRESVSHETGEIKEDLIPFMKTYTVFNLEEMDGAEDEVAKIKEAAESSDHKWAPIEAADILISASGAIIHHSESAQAFYRPSDDTIYMPNRTQFETAEKYYDVMLHELSHWTGHKDRLNRPMLNKFGTAEYAKEELRAELGSVFLSHETGIQHDIGNNVAYLQSWIKALKEDYREIFKAASAAQKIVDFLVAKRDAVKIAA